MTRSSLLLGLLLLPAVAGAQPATSAPAPAPATTLPLKHVGKPTTSPISAADLMTRLYIFADDSMMGRDAGTQGHVKGSDYIAAEVKRLGLVPAGENGTYFQTLPLKRRTLDPASRFSIGADSLGLGTDWSIGGNGPLTAANVPTVYGGTYGDSAKRITAEQAAGKLVLMTVPLTNEAINGLLMDEGPYAPSSAAGVAFLMPAPVARQLFAFVGRSGISVIDGPPKPAFLFVNAGALSKAFTKPLDQLAIGDVGANATVNATVNLVDSPFPARNVVAILPGSDPTLKAEYVAVGAHSDHVGTTTRAADHDSVRIFYRLVRPGGAEDGGKMATPEQVAKINAELAELRKTTPPRRDSIFNGADDDGSGSVSVLEIAEYMAGLKVKPKRSTLFVWHVGEEKGLWGSHYYTEHPTVPRESIIAQLNMDMVGRGASTDQTGKSKDGKDLFGGPDYLQLVGSRRLSTELGDLVERVNTTKKHGFTFDYGMDANGHPMNIYCRSDHYEYARWNIPVTFFTTGGHAEYHQLTDEPQYIDYPHMSRVAKLVADIALTVGNSAKRPVVDGMKMDPRGSCKQ
jgi:hypothetical protein